MSTGPISPAEASLWSATLARIPGRSLVVGIAGLLACLAAGLVAPTSLLPAYLVAYLFWIGISLGCVAITMLHHLVGGGWGLIIRRPLESGAMTLLPMAILFVPVALGMGSLYPWTQPGGGGTEDVRRYYLNPTAFLARTAGYFVLWFTLAWLLNRWSAERDRTGSEAAKRRLQRLSGPGLALCFLTSSFAAIDWVMSLEPRWYSSIYGAMLITGFGLVTFAAMIVVAGWLSRYEPGAGAADIETFHDLGNLLLAFVMLWAYMAFSQFLIVWSGNLVEEIPWYLRRTRGGWQYVALALILFHFFVPFFFLLFRDVKRGTRLLMGVASAIVAMHLVDLAWLVLPARAADPLRPAIPWGALALVLVATAGIGGVWVAAFARQLASRPPLPRETPGV